jgi:hypothetical protein
MVRGSNPGWGETFRTCPDRPWGPPSLLYNGYRVFLWGKERPGRNPDPSPLSSAVGHERVELNLYSPYGPYSLYRASVPVQRSTLPFFLDLPIQRDSGGIVNILIVVIKNVHMNICNSALPRHSCLNLKVEKNCVW